VAVFQLRKTNDILSHTRDIHHVHENMYAIKKIYMPYALEMQNTRNENHAILMNVVRNAFLGTKVILKN